jgi:toxin ParE1/3/4
LYITQYDVKTASNFIEDIVAKTRWIAATGFAGAPRDALSPGLKALPYRERCTYFRTSDSAVHILRILHGRRDISSDDFSESND